MMHAQTRGDLAQPLSTGCEEPAQQSPAFELLQPRLPAFHARSQPGENSRQFGRNRALSFAEQRPV